MGNVILNAIVQKLADGTLQCERMISNDGVTTRNFTIDRLSGIFEGVSLDADLSRQNTPPLGKALGIAKNLDEYQLKICLIVSSLSVTDPIKLNLQKFRLAIVASFAVLVVTLKSRHTINGLESWNFFATKLLIKISEFISKLGTDTRPDSDAGDSYLEETFKYFHIPLTDTRIAIKNNTSLIRACLSSRRYSTRRNHPIVNPINHTNAFISRPTHLNSCKTS